MQLLGQWRKATLVAFLGSLLALGIWFQPSAVGVDGDVTCTGSFGGMAPHDLIVPPGATCHTFGATVAHDVEVGSGAKLDFESSHAGHDINAEEPGGIDIWDSSSVGHDIQIDGVSDDGPSPPGGFFLDPDGGGGTKNVICSTDVGHDVSITDSLGSAAEWTLGDTSGDDSPFTCGASNTIHHDLVVADNANVLDIGENTVGHNIDVGDNSGSTDIKSNSAGHDAKCEDNGAADGPTGGNTAGHRNTCG